MTKTKSGSNLSTIDYDRLGFARWSIDQICRMIPEYRGSYCLSRFYLKYREEIKLCRKRKGNEVNVVQPKTRTYLESCCRKESPFEVSESHFAKQYRTEVDEIEYTGETDFSIISRRWKVKIMPWEDKSSATDISEASGLAQIAMATDGFFNNFRRVARMDPLFYCGVLNNGTNLVVVIKIKGKDLNYRWIVSDVSSVTDETNVLRLLNRCTSIMNYLEGILQETFALPDLESSDIGGAAGGAIDEGDGDGGPGGDASGGAPDDKPSAQRTGKSAAKPSGTAATRKRSSLGTIDANVPTSNLLVQNLKFRSNALDERMFARRMDSFL